MRISCNAFEEEFCGHVRICGLDSETVRKIGAEISFEGFHQIIIKRIGVTYILGEVPEFNKFLGCLKSDHIEIIVIDFRIFI